MVALPPPGQYSVGQDEQAKSMIRLLKQYRRERTNADARRALAIAIKTLADRLVEIPDAGGIPRPR